MFQLDEACFAPEFRFSRAALRGFASARNAQVVIAQAGDAMAGFCVVHTEPVPRGPVGYVVTLDVAREFRRQGLAAELLRRAEQAAAAAGCTAMGLHVFTGNRAAIRFYERCGYGLTGVAAKFYGRDAAGSGLDALVYRKAL